MKITINKCGDLEIWRHGKFKMQWCPRVGGRQCGDWCPLFGEPEKIINIDNNGIKLSLCEVDLRCGIEEFQDGRS
jgi:hypothetical protein